MTFRLPILFSAFLVAATPATWAASGDTIGEAIEVINLVTADYSRDVRTLQAGDDVRQDEKISVGSDGRSELEFADKTKIALGPRSELVLDKFIYDPDKKTGSIVMDIVEGTLRFITGVAQKRTYVIRTRNASITVRGTIFDVYSPPKGATYLLLHEGGVQVCNKKGKCRVNNGPGKLLRISEKGDIDEAIQWAGLKGHEDIPFDLAFPFVVNPPLIDPSPIFSKDDIINAALPKKIYKKKAKAKKKYKKKKAKKTQRKKKKVIKKARKKRKKRTKSADNTGKILGAAAAIAIGIAISKGRKKHPPPSGGHHPKY